MMQSCIDGDSDNAGIMAALIKYTYKIPFIDLFGREAIGSISTHQYPYPFLPAL
jgi:hypothetical protein